MLSAPQIIVKILLCLFFFIVATACLLWPKKFYEHALRPVYRKSDAGDESLQDLQKRSYVWDVRIIGIIAALMFTFIVIHLFSSTPIDHGGATSPVRSLPKPLK